MNTVESFWLILKAPPNTIFEALQDDCTSKRNLRVNDHAISTISRYCGAIKHLVQGVKSLCTNTQKNLLTAQIFISLTVNTLFENQIKLSVILNLSRHISRYRFYLAYESTIFTSCSRMFSSMTDWPSPP